MSVLKQLLEIYYTNEWWHGNALSYEEAYKYHSKMLNEGNIIYCERDGEVLGYVEFWKVSPSQFKRLAEKEEFSAYLEDVQTGEICWVANVFIKKPYRNNGVYGSLKRKLFEINKDCIAYAGTEVKRAKRLRIYRNKEKNNGK
jgi:hypothetical protein